MKAEAVTQVAGVRIELTVKEARDLRAAIRILLTGDTGLSRDMYGALLNMTELLDATPTDGNPRATTP